MAGYIMTLDSIESLKLCIETGTYSTNMSVPRNNVWRTHHEGTFADYLSMKENDNIYFFIKRKIYGIGRIITIGDDCKYLNYLSADEPRLVTENEYRECHPLLPYGNENNRCFCTFKPSPLFFTFGVDMDDALNSNPSKFRMLRAMWKVSFIKIDDEENKALIDIILKRNESEISAKENIFRFSKKVHHDIQTKVDLQYKLNSRKILTYCRNNNLIKHEMAIEAALCEILTTENDTPFGRWDYISHQVVASPFKAIDYMDKMDVFGYKYINGYKTISKYLVIELKKDVAEPGVIDQIMKYVDWIKSEYTYGDYSMIQAYVIAADFPDEVVEKKEKECVRYYTKGYRPTQSCKWTNVNLIKYKFKDEKLLFSEV